MKTWKVFLVVIAVVLLVITLLFSFQYFDVLDFSRLTTLPSSSGIEVGGRLG